MAESNVLVHADEVATALTAAIKGQDIPALVNELLATPVFQGELEWWVESQISDKPEVVLANLKQADSEEAFHQWFSSLLNVSFEEDGSSHHDLDCGVFEIMFEIVAERGGFEWPNFSVIYFGGGQDISLSNGDIYFAFQEDECFTCVLTGKGKFLQGIVGGELSVTAYD